MAELSITPSTANIASRTARSNEAPDAESDTATSAPATFAATLKSQSEKLADKKTTDATSAQEAMADNKSDSASVVSSTNPAILGLSATETRAAHSVVDPATLLAQLQTEASGQLPDPVIAELAATMIPSALHPAVTVPPVRAEGSATLGVATFSAGIPPTEKGGTGKNDKQPTGGKAESNILSLNRPSATDRNSIYDNKLATQAAISAPPDRAPANAASADHQDNFQAAMSRTLHIADGTASPAVFSPMPTPHADLRMATSPGQAGWPEEIGQRLTWMVANNRQQADLVLHPPQLGRIEITLTLDGNQASASFASPNVAVREALENALTQLRTVLADAGVTLGQTHVGTDQRQGSSDLPNGRGNSAEGKRQGMILPDIHSNVSPRPLRSGHGMVDLFA